ncbi:hypothetical protein RP20_CCG007846 [Aedes albopictus]|nr:uncharacterized protein LOC115264083 [Aedes albopictus]KXJ77330.1 hypothetical protein RP20_CCG007846 [Aedes albopictus]
MSSMLAVASGLLVLTASTIAMTIRVQLDRFEQQKGFSLVDATGLRVRKYNRTTSVLNGECDIFYDIGDNYTSTLTMAYSRLGNNQFNEYPMKFSKAKMCDFFNGQYKEYQYLFKGSSNLPQVGNDRICPFPRGHYWVKNWAPDSSWVPSVIPAGYWRFTYIILDLQDNVMLRHLAFLHITKGF